MSAHKNIDRWTGFAALYDDIRPACPEDVIRVLVNYLGRPPQTVIDLGCGTGLSTMLWSGAAGHVIGVEPSDDMRDIAVAKAAHCGNLTFVKAFSDQIPLPDGMADIITCSQSFHWMEPGSTLREVNRLLRPDGIFAAYDCDWPPVCSLAAEMAYEKLCGRTDQIEAENQGYRDAFIRYPKEGHLANIRASGYFRFTREIVFSNTERCGSERYIGIALSQGGLQAILKQEPQLIEDDLREFRAVVEAEFGGGMKEVTFCYRMRLGVKALGQKCS